MKRLLLIGKNMPRLDSIDWAGCLTHNILDYQGLLFDCRQMGEFAGEDGLSGLLTQYGKAGHPIFLILPDLKNHTSSQRNLLFLPWPTGVKVVKAPGKTLTFASAATQPFSKYFECLKGHEVIFELFSRAGQPRNVTPRIVDNLNRLVCGSVDGMNLYIFHPPHRSSEVEAFRILVDYFKPDFVEPEPGPAPEWVPPLVSTMPGINEIEVQIAEIMVGIDNLEKQADGLSVKKNEIEKWAELLWLDGVPLQRRVREALDFLGFETEMPDPTGHAEDIIAKHGTHRFLIEVTGATGSVKIDKARELVHWVLASESPDQVRGVLVGNPFRNDPPQQRPPSPNHKLFTNEVEVLATRFDFALLEVRELYKAILAKLEYKKEVDVVKICEAISVKGIVVLGF